MLTEQRLSTSLPIDRLPPQNTEAEEAVLGSCLMDSDCTARIRGILQPGDFYRERNGTIYSAMLALDDRHEPVDFLTVTNELKRTGRYEEVGGLAYLSELVGVVPTAVHAEHYARLVWQCSLRRQLISAAARMAAIAYDEETDVESAMAKAVDLLGAVQARAGGVQIHTPEARAGILIDYVERLSGGEPPGMPTGLDVDRALHGLKRGRLYLVAARPRTGKTSLLQTIARNLARAGRKVLFCSLEMSDEELVTRDAAALMRRDWNDTEDQLARGQASPSVVQAVRRAVDQIAEMPLYVVDMTDATSHDVRAAGVAMKARYGLDALFVDYLQLLADQDRQAANRDAQIGFISRRLKATAKLLGVPVVVACQLNRESVKRRDKRPQLEDLRESGNLEQDADVVLGIYRDELYNEKAEKNKAELLVLKHRGGEGGCRFYMTWLPRYTEYVNYSREVR